MRLLLGLLFCFAVATTVGLGATWLAATSGSPFGSITVGVWTAWPRNGTSDIDPYARALTARSGSLPVGIGDGVAFFARHDDSGRPFDGRCEVVLTGTTPQARYWTITLYDTEGQLVANSLGRHGFTSQELVRQQDRSFEISVGPRARAGNWLPSGGVDRYVLVIRLYDTPVGVAARSERDVPMPSVTRRACT